jgi:alpha-D-ribose 1-methylphosphonate 5-triphosphate synthase subunit PhnL
MISPILQIENMGKRFTLHHQQGTQLPVLNNVNLNVDAGECVILDGPSGTGKSTLLKLIYANYRATTGRVVLYPGTPQEVDLSTAPERALLAARRDMIGYVSQFLRAIPRVPALDVVAEPLMEGKDGPDATRAARAEAGRWLERLRIPSSLWQLPPATFSGGEQQRVNIARSMIKPRPILLLDEPTASLDAANTQTVIELVHDARKRGTAIVGIFHDPNVAAAVATRRVAVSQFGGDA